MSKQNFYEELDLKYIEIGYNMKPIDRTNPGIVPFNIPVLTPQMDNSTMKDSKIIQRDKSNIQNASVGSIEVSDLQMSNYIEIQVPKEICCLPSAEYFVEGSLNYKGNMDANGSGSYTFESFNINVTGTVHDNRYTDGVGYVSASGNASSSKANYSSKESFIADGKIDGTITLIPTKEYRYIPAGSRWAICFIGGDINMPMVMCKLPDEK